MIRFFLHLHLPAHRDRLLYSGRSPAASDRGKFLLPSPPQRAKVPGFRGEVTVTSSGARHRRSTQAERHKTAILPPSLWGRFCSSHSPLCQFWRRSTRRPAASTARPRPRTRGALHRTTPDRAKQGVEASGAGSPIRRPLEAGLLPLSGGAQLSHRPLAEPLILPEQPLRQFHLWIPAVPRVLAISLPLASPANRNSRRRP